MTAELMVAGKGRRTEAPGETWPFAPDVEQRGVEVDGATVRYRVWGEPDGDERPGLLFLHGFRAHSHWWDHIVPFFTDEYRVAVMDLTGFGDSDPRPEHGIRHWASEILAVSEAAGLLPVTIVAHSYSGHPTLHAAKRQPAAMRRAVIMDTQLWVPESSMPTEENSRLLMKNRKRVYPTREEALDRYRLVPPAAGVPPTILAHVAEHSIKPVEGGWTWKFDETVNPLNLDDPDRLTPAGIEVPVDYLYGVDSSVVPADQARLYAARFPTCRHPIEAPGVGHHMLLENPAVVVAVLRGLFANPRT